MCVRNMLDDDLERAILIVVMEEMWAEAREEERKNPAPKKRSEWIQDAVDEIRF